MSISVGIIDEPVAPGATDSLDISIHSRSLIKFIQKTNTPITVGIQGEWGSGKTSLINSIYHAFEDQQEVKQIWINSWEYSLLSTPEEALLKIVNRIIDELLESDTDVNRKAAIKEGAGKIFRGALRVGAQVVLGWGLAQRGHGGALYRASAGETGCISYSGGSAGAVVVVPDLVCPNPLPRNAKALHETVGDDALNFRCGLPHFH